MARVFVPGRGEPESPSNSLGYFFREAARRIWVSKRTSTVAIVMIAISLFILGAFLLLSENLRRAIERWQGGSHVNVYLADDITPAQLQDIDHFLTAHRSLGQRRFVTRQQALASFRRDFQNLNGVLDQLDANPFPASYEISVSAEVEQTQDFRSAIAALRGLPGVDEVQLDWEWLARLRRLIGIIDVAGIVAGGVLAIAAAFTIANVIRLTMLLYREEIEIMRLVGATEGIIRGPFLVEGILQGTIGGVVAVLLLYAGFAAGRLALASPQSVMWTFLFAVFLPWQKVAALIAGGLAAGWFGSWLSVRATED